MSYQRPLAVQLRVRLAEPPRRLVVLAGPRQVGKTTLLRQVLADRPTSSYLASAADNPSLPPEATGAFQLVHPVSGQPTREWLQALWMLAERRAQAWSVTDHPMSSIPFVLAIDEIQWVGQWSSVVKGLWDASQARGIEMHVVLLGSAPLLVQQGLSESLAGRYELLRMGHWSFEEMNDAFGCTVEEYVYFGGYPGSAHLMADEPRWRAYVRDALVEPNIQKDVLAMTRVDKPAMLRQLFELGCAYSAQILSLDKVRGQLGGHTDTLAHHLTLLAQAGLLGGLHKFAAQTVRQRASPPKFQVHNNALMSVGASYAFGDAQGDRGHWGRLVESTVGAHLVNTADPDTRLHYWRERDLEVDFIIEYRGRLAAIEVKSRPDDPVRPHRGLAEFCRRHPDARSHVVGGERLPLDEFLRRPAAYWTT